MTSTVWDPPWRSLPEDLPEQLAPVIPGLVEHVIQVVPAQVPAYAAARDSRYGENLTRGVLTAFEQLLRLPGTSLPALNEQSRAVMAALGAGEFREGRSMDALLGAYRTAARIAFRTLSEECARQGMDLSVVVDLGESIWAYIDELSSVSAQAYAQAQSARAGELELRRAALAFTLVRGETDEAEVRRLCAAAEWGLPERIAVAVLPTAPADQARRRLGMDTLVMERDGEVVALLPTPDPRPARVRGRAARRLAETGAVVGPSVPFDEVPYSYRLARTLADQRDPGDRDPMLVEDHLREVLLGAEPQVARQLADRALAPLDGLTDAKRQVMEQTLLAWLTRWGRREEMGELLGVHPQTVGYRVRRLRELFGERLEDPEHRFDLETALRARRVRLPGQ